MAFFSLLPLTGMITPRRVIRPFFVGLLKYVIYACNFLALGLYVITIDDFLKIENGVSIVLTRIQGDICDRNEMSHTYSIDIIFNFHQELLINLLSAFLYQELLIILLSAFSIQITY